MKGLLIIFILLTAQYYGQDTLAIPEYDWTDTTHKSITFQNLSTLNGIIEYDISKNAILYLSYEDFKNSCSKRVSQHLRGQEYKTLLNRVDSIASVADTVKWTDNNLVFDLITSELLNEGKGRVYDKINNQIVVTISHRLEKYGAQAHRFFYLPDRRTFFSVMELSGILEKDKDPLEALSEYYIDYIKLGKRVREFRKLEE